MARPPHTTRKKSISLIDRLHNNSQLSAYIENLAPPVLNKLIHCIGKEDAQELMRLATDDQIQQIIETDTWHSSQPGAAEIFDPARFLEWLDLWNDMSPAFLTSKLKSLGSELLALTLQHYVVIVDLEEVGVSDHVDTFHQFGVMPLVEDNWELVFKVLTDLWNEDADFLEECLSLSCLRRSLTVEKTHVTANENLQQDVDEKRDRNRRDKGYVTSQGASAFLSQARNSRLDSLLIEVVYDAFTAMHLNTMARQKESVTKAPETPTRSGDEQASNVKGADESWRELDCLLIDLKIVDPAPFDRLLASPVGEEELFIKQQLRLLAQDNPEALNARQQELVFLANVVIEGTPVQHLRINETEAATCVYATCNLALLYCVFEESWGNEAEVVNSLLHGSPGLVKAFKIGYYLLCELRNQVVAALEQALMSPRVRIQLRGNQWLQQRVTDAFASFMLRHDASTCDPALLSSLLDVLSLVADNEVCQQLRILGDGFPCFPESLQPGSVAEVHVNKRWRYIDKPADLQLLAGFLNGLDKKLL